MTDRKILYTLLLCSCFAMVFGSTKSGKAISVFNIVKFENGVCNGTDNKYGTCYTEDECEDKGGKASGSCAEGYGVCCVFTAGCGDTIGENSTYFESNGASIGACNTKVCKCNSNICQMRLDFTTFVIDEPTTATTTVSKTLFGLADPAAGADEMTGRGRCDTDSFAVSVAGGSSTPVICGTNTGQHMYIDVPTDCALLSFHLADGVSTTRQWAIEVTQFSCDYENLAPQGCLQYHFGNSGAGNVESFNFNAGNGIHLANQNQMICVRREANMCKICWAPAAAGDFSLSMATPTTGTMGTVNGMGHNGAVCGYGMDGKGAMGYDHVIIPQPEDNASPAVAGPGTSKFCGSTLAIATAADMTADKAPATVCSKSVPFNIRFLSDNTEHNMDTVSKGFKLAYVESKC